MKRPRAILLAAAALFAGSVSPEPVHAALIFDIDVDASQIAGGSILALRDLPGFPSTLDGSAFDNTYRFTENEHIAITVGPGIEYDLNWFSFASPVLGPIPPGSLSVELLDENGAVLESGAAAAIRCAAAPGPGCSTGHEFSGLVGEIVTFHGFRLFGEMPDAPDLALPFGVDYVFDANSGSIAVAPWPAVAAVSEPGAFAMFGSGLLALSLLRGRRRKGSSAGSGITMSGTPNAS